MPEKPIVVQGSGKNSVKKWHLSQEERGEKKE